MLRAARWHVWFSLQHTAPSSYDFSSHYFDENCIVSDHKTWLSVSRSLFNMRRVPLADLGILTLMNLSPASEVCVCTRGDVRTSQSCGLTQSLRPIMFAELQRVSVSTGTNIPAIIQFGFQDEHMDFALSVLAQRICIFHESLSG